MLIVWLAWRLYIACIKTRKCDVGSGGIFAQYVPGFMHDQIHLFEGGDEGGSTEDICCCL